jgi:hypothetical protein
MSVYEWPSCFFLSKIYRFEPLEALLEEELRAGQPETLATHRGRRAS